MYAYCNNNPVNTVDQTGCKPGDLFATPEEAAADFGNLYNGRSIKSNREMATLIYEITVVKKHSFLFFSWETTKTYYSYGGIIIGNSENIYIPYQENVNGHKTVAVAHTHAEFDLKGNNEVFSNNDYAFLSKHKTTGFLITPNGKLIKQDYFSEGYAPIEISSKIAHDPIARNAALQTHSHHCKNCVY